jgi:glyoxylate utilization-related uncharacterized protein
MSPAGAGLLVYERKYALPGGRAAFQTGNTEEQAVLPVPGEVFVLRKLLPQTDDYDFNVHVMDFKPGGWGWRWGGEGGNSVGLGLEGRPSCALAMPALYAVAIPIPRGAWGTHITETCMCFAAAPGEYLNVKEVHYNQHGLLLLSGKGIYLLGKDWYPVQSGDVVWMAPYVPQWYAALGYTNSRYIIYKDTTVDPLN